MSAALHASAHAARITSGREACCSRSAAPAPSSSRAAWAPHHRPRRAASTSCAASAAQGATSSSSGGARSSGQRRRRAAPPRAAAEAEAPGGALVPDRQGYRSFLMEGCEFLVAETADGRLDLADMYVTTDAPTRVGFVVGENPWADEDDEQPGSAGSAGAIDVSPEQSYRRPEGLEELQPPAPREYHAVPWTSYWAGDTVKEKSAKAWVWRYYLVPVASRQPELRLDFDGELFVLDARAATVRRCEVHRLAPPDTPQHELRLRIRDEVVTIDTGASVPDWEEVVVARKSGLPALSQLEQQRVQEYLTALEQALQMGTIDEAEFEEAYDVHWLAATVAGSAGVEALGEGFAAVEQAGELEAASPEFEPEADIMGGWDEDSYRDLMQDQDDELMEDMDFEDDFDSPAADY